MEATLYDQDGMATEVDDLLAYVQEEIDWKIDDVHLRAGEMAHMLFEHDGSLSGIRVGARTFTPKQADFAQGWGMMQYEDIDWEDVIEPDCGS